MIRYSNPTPGHITAAAAKSLQSCSTLCDPIDGSPLGSTVPGILQARTLERVAILFSNAWKWTVKVKVKSCRTLATPWTAAYQAPPSMGFSRQEYWSGVPLPSRKTQNLRRYMFPSAYCNAIYNSQDLETTYMDINRWMNKDAVHICNEILLSHKNNEIMWSAATWMQFGHS